MERNLESFLKIKTANSLTSKQNKLFKIPDFDKGWHKRYAQITLNEEDWATALDSLSGSKGKFNRLNRQHTKKQDLYLMESTPGLFKIGISCNPRQRRSALQTGSGIKIKLVAVWSCELETIGVERNLHMVFEDYKAAGEWFNFGEDGYSIVQSYLNNNPSLTCKRKFYSKV